MLMFIRLLAGAACVLLTGCATILNRSEEPIPVTSSPPGATAAIECEGGVRAIGTTPATLSIPRTSQGCVLTISKDGFATKTIAMERGYGGAFWSNWGAASLVPASFGAYFGGADGWEYVLGTGVIGALGFVVDRANGRGYRHFPDVVDVVLEAESPPRR